jgi:hypothetical protein
MRDTGKVVSTLAGSVLFCAAIAGTIQAFMDGSRNGPTVGGIFVGFGLWLLIIPWLRDDAPDVKSAEAEDDLPTRKINAA